MRVDPLGNPCQPKFYSLQAIGARRANKAGRRTTSNTGPAPIRRCHHCFFSSFTAALFGLVNSMSGSSAAVASSSQMEMVASSPQQHLECPFCQFHDESEYVLLLHIEALHTDDSPFVVKDDPANTGLTGSLTDSLRPGSFNQLDYEFGSRTEDDEEMMYVLCPEPGCEEPVLLMELQTHLDFHDAEQISMEDVRHARREYVSSGSSGSSSGGSGGNSPWEKDEGTDTASSRGSTERRGERGDGGSKSSSVSVKREKRENRTLMISRDGVVSRESVVLKDGHRERAGQRERDKMLEREREKDRGRDRQHEIDSHGRRIIYADPGPSSPSSTISPRHLHKSPKRFYKTTLTAVGFSLSPDKESKKPSARSNTDTPYKNSGVKRLGVCEVAFSLLSYSCICQYIYFRVIVDSGG